MEQNLQAYSLVKEIQEAYEHLYQPDIEPGVYGKKLSHENTMNYINYLIQADHGINIQDIQAMLTYAMQSEPNAKWAQDTRKLWDDPGMRSVNEKTGTPVINNVQYTDAFLRHAGVQIQKAKLQGRDIEPIMAQVSDAIATRPQLEIPLVRHFLKEHYNQQDVAIELAERARKIEINTDKYLEQIAPQIERYDEQASKLKDAVIKYLDPSIALTPDSMQKTQEHKHALHVLKENLAAAIHAMMQNVNENPYLNQALLLDRVQDAKNNHMEWANTLSEGIDRAITPTKDRADIIR